MAYKFQLGAFVASGSIKAEDGVNANSAGVGAAGGSGVITRRHRHQFDRYKAS